MEVTIAFEQRFWRTPDGCCWTEWIHPRAFWSRYLSVFSGVRIMARVHETASAQPNWTRVDGDGVQVLPVPVYVGPWQFALRAPRVRAAIARAVSDESSILLRVPGTIGWITSSILSRDRPYGLEVVGDPYDVFAPGAISHPLRPLLRYCFTRVLKRQCRNSPCSLYVTQHALQRRYPPRRSEAGSLQGYSVGISDVELSSAALLDENRLPARAEYQPNAGRNGPFAIIFVGTLDRPYKAPEVLIRAVARCVQSGLNARLTMVGNGQLRPGMERLAVTLGVSDRVRFTGSIPSGDPVRGQLDASDLFVLPSRVEGLPRAMVEAMARALPCVGTTVGGVPELLPREALVKPGDAQALAAKILELAENPAQRADWARRNLAKAREYRDEILQPKRKAFYQHLRDLTLDWQRRSER